MADSVLSLRPRLLPDMAPTIAPAAVRDVLRIKVLRESLSFVIGCPFDFRVIYRRSLYKMRFPIQLPLKSYSRNLNAIY